VREEIRAMNEKLSALERMMERAAEVEHCIEVTVK